jgi:DNA-binding transcriptional regulator YiaG
MGKRYHSDICKGIHESMRELLDIGAISETEMREFDELCLDREPGANPMPEFLGARQEPLATESTAVILGGALG